MRESTRTERRQSVAPRVVGIALGSLVAAIGITLVALMVLLFAAAAFELDISAPWAGIEVRGGPQFGLTADGRIVVPILVVAAITAVIATLVSRRAA